MATRYNWMADTDEKAFEVLVDLYRKMTPGHKLKLAMDTTTFVIQLSEMGVRHDHPDASEREVFLRAAARRLGRETIIRVYGWDPDGGEKP